MSLNFYGLRVSLLRCVRLDMLGKGMSQFLVVFDSSIFYPFSHYNIGSHLHFHFS